MLAADLTTRSTPFLGCIADDVTGATDLATNLVGGGLSVIQLMGLPAEEHVDTLAAYDAVVIALKTRAIPAEQAVAQSLQALQALLGLGVERFYFKYCSTFDSTAQGNIGPVAEALADYLSVSSVLYCPAFPRAGRTVYQGHLFVGDRLLHESGMQDHPLNPMTDADLRRWLSAQVCGLVGLLNRQTLSDGDAAVSRRLTSLADSGVRHVICDACDDLDLQRLAEPAARLRLLTGGSGLAGQLPDAYRACGMLDEVRTAPELPSAPGRNLILAGSCSTATNAQVNYMQGKCPTWRLDVANMLGPEADELSRLLDWVSEHDRAQTLMVASSMEPGEVRPLQERHGGERLADAIEQTLGEAAWQLTAEHDFRRLVLAGGETSGAIVQRLGIRALRIGPEICPGVPWTEATSGQNQLALALKSGNFGEENFFATALEMLA